jgi:DNA-binding NarL/FixJ family response regulator
MTDPPIRVVILDAFTIIRTGVRLILENQPGILVVGDAGDSVQGLKIVADQKPDIILLKLNPFGDPGLDVITRLLKTWNQARIILMTSTDEPESCIQAVREGVFGIVSKLQSPEVLIKAIKKVHAGEVWIEHSLMARLLTSGIMHSSYGNLHQASGLYQLTDREHEVIQMINRGLKNHQIAIQLSISESTVRHHLTSIYSKLGVSDRLELLILSRRKGLDLEPD